MHREGGCVVASGGTKRRRRLRLVANGGDEHASTCSSYETQLHFTLINKIETNLREGSHNTHV